MPNKNNLTAIKSSNKNTLKKGELNTVSTVNQGRAGRKPKDVSEKESETVVLKLTIQELENLKNRAGLVPLGTFIKHHLRNETEFFK